MSSFRFWVSMGLMLLLPIVATSETESAAGKGKETFFGSVLGNNKDVVCPQVGAIQCGGTVTGRLDLDDDCPLTDGTVIDQYAFSGTAGQEITVNLTSPTMDTFLILIDPQGNEEARNDDGGVGTNSQLADLVLQSTGQYVLWANSFAPEEGNYTMTLNCSTTGGGGGFPVDDRISGTWFDPTHDGEGWKVEIISDTTAVVYWFTYPPPGSPIGGKQSWMVAVARIEGDQIIADEVTITSGPSFGPGFNPGAVNRQNWGSFTMTFSGINSGTMTYDGTPAGFGTGTFNLSRLTAIANKQGKGTVDENVGSGISGTWFDPTHDGEGWLIEVIDSASALVYWFTYDMDGNQAWNVGLGDLKGNQIVVKEPVETEGTVFGSQFDPDDVARSKWGGYIFSFGTCGEGKMSYANQKGLGFDDFDITRLTGLDGVPCSDFDPTKAADNTLGVNPGDPLVLSSERKDGHKSEFFGQKASNGVPQSVGTVKIKDPKEHAGTIDSDPQNRPSQITDEEDGDILGISYTGVPTEIVLSGLTLSGKLQALLGVSIGPGGKVSTRPMKFTRREGEARAYVTDVPALGSKQAKTSTTSRFTVSQCGVPVDNALVNLNINAGGTVFDIPGRSIGNGTYEATIPTQASSQGAVSGQTSCQNFVDQIDGGCETFDLLNDLDIPSICRALAETMASNLPMDEEFDINLEGTVDFLESCAFNLYAAKLSCDSAGGRAGGGRTDFVCGNVVEEVDRSLDNLAASASFTASARLQGSNLIDTQVASNVNTGGPFPDFGFSREDVVSIVNFFTQPVDPEPFEGYTATARISCAGSNTPVLMTVTGTDGFQTSAECFITGSGDCNLDVPGGAEGVQDTLTVEIENGPSRQIQIVF